MRAAPLASAPGNVGLYQLRVAAKGEAVGEGRQALRSERRRVRLLDRPQLEAAAGGFYGLAEDLYEHGRAVMRGPARSALPSPARLQWGFSLRLPRSVGSAMRQAARARQCSRRSESLTCTP